MKVVRPFVRKSVAFAAALIAACAAFPAQQAAAQAPYLLPYTINSLGQGTAPTVGATCVGTNGVVGTAYDVYGDGCPISSGSVVIGLNRDLHDIGVDAQGNIYFIDNSAALGFVRRLDARSGIVTAYAGTPVGTPTINCGIPTPTQDKYGDGCPANDGKANVIPGTGTNYVYTGNFKIIRGLAVAKNGDVYVSGYNESLVHRISLANGTYSLVAGLLTGGTVAAPKNYTGLAGYSGDGSAAAGVNGAKISSPRGSGVDLAGNVFIADSANNVIRKVTAATGNISTVVGAYPGTSTPASTGATGDGGPATSATLTTPEDVVVDPQGNLYIADFGNSKVRMVYMGGAAQAAFIAKTNAGAVATVGNIYTVVGGGPGVYTSGSVVLSTSVPIAGTRRLALDSRNNIYVADSSSNVIWFIDQATGFMRVIAGEFQKSTTTGTFCAGAAAPGDGCPATQATLAATSTQYASSDLGVAVDGAGNIIIADSGDAEIRRVSTNQIFASTAINTSTSQTLLVHFAAGDALGGTYTITGSTDFTFTAGTCTINADTTQDCPVTVTFTPTRPGTEQASLSVRSAGNGTAIFGLSGFGVAASVALDPGATSSFGTGVKAPQGIAQDGAGITYVADTGNNRVLRYSSANTFTVLAGTGVAGYTGDAGPATAATLKAPRAVTVARDGSILIADTGNNVIRSVSPVTGNITTYAGAGTAVCAAAVDMLGDGCPATQATFNAPAGLIADTDGNVYVSDTGNNLVRELTPAGYSVYIAGGATTVCANGDTFGNGCTGTGTILSGPTGIAVDLAHNVYVADTGNSEVRKITAGGLVSALAGTGQSGGSGNGGPATGAQLANPTGVAIDAAGNLYIADTGNSVIRIVNGSGVITSVAGTLGASGTGTLPGSAFAVQLNAPSAVVSTGQGRLLIVDAGNNRLFADDRGSITYDFGRTNQGFSSPTLQIQETSTGSAATTIKSPLFTVTSTTPTGVNQFTLAGTTSNGCSAPSTLAPGTSCLLAAQFTPTQLGMFNATFTETTTNTINVPTPFITLLGTGAVLTPTTSASVVTTPANGMPTYAVPFVVTTTITAACNTAAPACSPTGTVNFFVDGAQVGLGVQVNGGSASQTISGLSVGTHIITANYSGDNFYASSSAPPLTVTIAQGISKPVVSATPNPVPQFANLTLNASVTGPIATSFPTGSFKFYAGTTLLGMVGVNPTTGTGSLSDVYTPAVGSTPAHYAQTFGLNAGVYQLTVVYSGDANYAASTSPAVAFTVSAQAPAFIFDPKLVPTVTQLSPSTTGTAQGSTGQTTLFLAATNTVSGTVNFACSGMPAHSDCTFGPTSLTFAPTPGAATLQSTQITLFTDVPDSALTSSSLLGWPVLIVSMLGMMMFRRKLRRVRLLGAIALFGVLAGGSMALSGCKGPSNIATITPTGVYNVTVTVSGSNAPTVTIPIVFTVTTGVPGQL